MFYLTTYSTVYLRLYGVRYMIKDHSDSERGSLLLPHGQHPTDRITHTTACVTTVMEQWLEREIAIWIQHGRSIRRPIAQLKHFEMLKWDMATRQEAFL